MKLKIIVPVVVSLAIVLGSIAFYAISSGNNSSNNANSNYSISRNSFSSQSSYTTSEEINSDWQRSEFGFMNPNQKKGCGVEKFDSPVSTSLVQSVLYPGQVRGNDFKPHGGFRFSNSTNSVEVKLPLSAKLVEGSRYIEGGEVQYLFRFITDCGTMIGFDHILTPSQKLLQIAESFSDARQGDSRTTAVNVQERFNEGEVVATEIGFKKTKNVTVDFGVYDLNKENEASKDPSFLNKYGSSYLAKTALCFFDSLNELDKATLLSKEAGDSVQKKFSYYCK